MYCTIYFNKYVTKVDEYSISPLNTIKCILKKEKKYTCIPKSYLFCQPLTGELLS
jgi:hypothetical protein